MLSVYLLFIEIQSKVITFAIIGRTAVNSYIIHSVIKY